jgi:hypothetical protein
LAVGVGDVAEGGQGEAVAEGGAGVEEGVGGVRGREVSFEEEEVLGVGR